MERGWKPSAEVSPACPRCGSSNTKFCYYNNYSLTQPRYFCKGCRRYWTKGGSLRNVPIGGGCRKSRRGKSGVRVSTDGGAGSRSFAHNGIDQSNGQVSTGHDHHASTSNIDLAAVYANFLNQNPRPDNSNQNIQETVSVSRAPAPDGVVVNSNVNILPVMEFPGFQGFQMSPHLPQEVSHGFFDYGQFNSRLPETQLLGVGNSMFFGGPDGFLEKSGIGNLISSGNDILNPVYDAMILPPLPGGNLTAASDQAGLLWPGSDANLLQNESNNLLPSNDDGTTTMQVGQKSDSEVLDLDGNMMSPFSALNLEAIFRS